MKRGMDCKSARKAWEETRGGSRQVEIESRLLEQRDYTHAHVTGLPALRSTRPTRLKYKNFDQNIGVQFGKLKTC
jgi:hypothetical protein